MMCSFYVFSLAANLKIVFFTCVYFLLLYISQDSRHLPRIIIIFVIASSSLLLLLLLLLLHDSEAPVTPVYLKWYACICACMCVYGCVSLCMYMYVCVWLCYATYM